MSGNTSSFDNSSDVANNTFSPVCGGGHGDDGRLGVHIAAVFIILVTSTFGALFPMSAKKLPRLRVPQICFTFAKFFGSGVIIATAFIHLLASSFQELGNPCLSTFWDVDYPWPAAFSMISVFSLFLVELFAMRFAHIAFATTDAVGTTEHNNPSVMPDPFPPDVEGHQPEASKLQNADTQVVPLQTNSGPRLDARLIGFFILEFGVIFHSVIIGLTLSTTGANFNTLFIVIIFHQMFEGLGLGSRLAILPFKEHSLWPWVLGGIYGLVTPIGMAIGLGLRTTYDAASQTALIVSGILDAVSSGILLYTGLVELLAHEFLFSKGSIPLLFADQLDVREGPTWNLLFSVASLMGGTALMALLGKWA